MSFESGETEAGSTAPSPPEPSPRLSAQRAALPRLLPPGVLGFELVWGQRCRPALVALLGARDCLRWAEEAPLPSVLLFFSPFCFASF